MLSKESIKVQLISLPHTCSDLEVGIEARDTHEILIQSRILAHMAEECEAVLLRETSQAIEQCAIAGDLDSACSLISELHHRLQQALGALQQQFKAPLS
jgi:hypothetical protein